MSNRKRGKGQAVARRARQQVRAEAVRRLVTMRDVAILTGQWRPQPPEPDPDDTPPES